MKTGVGQMMVRAPGRTRGAFTSKSAFTSKMAGTGAPQASSITMRAAADLDQWYVQHGCTGCEDMGSDLRVRTLAFKAAALLDPATQNNVSLNVSTPLAQSGFGPGTDAALTLVLGASRQSKGHCTDDNGNCLQVASPAIPLELQTLANALNAQINGIISSGQQVPQTDATLQALVQQIVGAFQQFAQMLKGAISSKEQPPPPPPSPGPQIIPQQQQPAPTPVKTTSNVGLALGVVGIALVALGTGAVIMTVSQKKKARGR